jgi:hypothetical protein
MEDAVVVVAHAAGHGDEDGKVIEVDPADILAPCVAGEVGGGGFAVDAEAQGTVVMA